MSTAWWVAVGVGGWFFYMLLVGVTCGLAAARWNEPMIGVLAGLLWPLVLPALVGEWLLRVGRARVRRGPGLPRAVARRSDGES